MKKFRNCLGGMLVLLCLLGSCSGGTDHGGSIPLDEEGIEEKTKDPDKDDNEDGKKKNDTGDNEDTNKKISCPAVFIICKTLPENEIVFEFSDPVSFVSLSFDPDLKFKVIEKEGSEVIIKLTENLVPGLSVEADLLVTDEYENTINEQVTFRTRNNRVPRLQINELYTEYSKPKAEFIEFKMLSEGNLSGLCVFAEWNNKTPQIYEFAPMEVKAGEYVVLHLRMLEESCKDEDTEKLDVSLGTDSCPTARDLWIPGSKKLLHKTDAIYVQDQDGKVLDAIMMTENSSSVWNNKGIAAAAKFLFDQGAWKSPEGGVCSPVDAVDTSGIKSSITKSISRNEGVENTHTAADWYVTTSGGVTPGLPNKP